MLKKILINALGSRPFVYSGGKIMRNYVPIFMLHRFNYDDLDIYGHELSLLQSALEYLRKRKFNFVSVDDVALSIKNNEPLPERSVAFSLDDGYWDQVEMAGQIFSSFDCPATYFVTTGFINGDLWFWDAKIHYLLENASESAIKRLVVELPHLHLEGLGKYAAATKIVFSVTSKSIQEIESFIALLAKSLQIDVPEKAPEKYSATTWEKLSEMERMGLRVGAHTYSHPLLSRETDENSKNEISNSLVELKKRILKPCNVFCYPVGRQQDFGKREEQYVSELGFSGGVSAMPGAVNTRDSSRLYSMPRFGFPDTMEDFIQYASWIEPFKSAIR